MQEAGRLLSDIENCIVNVRDEHAIVCNCAGYHPFSLYTDLNLYVAYIYFYIHVFFIRKKFIRK